MIFVPWDSKGQAMMYAHGLFNPVQDFWNSMTGFKQNYNTQLSTKKQIDYNEYLNAGNQRAIDDWNNTIGKKGHGRTIRYPELSYAGAVARANTGSYRAMYDASNSSANYYGNLPYRGLGLYGVGSRVSRWL